MGQNGQQLASFHRSFNDEMRQACQSRTVHGRLDQCVRVVAVQCAMSR